MGRFGDGWGTGIVAAARRARLSGLNRDGVCRDNRHKSVMSPA
jgi:hypothetical protein